MLSISTNYTPCLYAGYTPPMEKSAWPLLENSGWPPFGKARLALLENITANPNKAYKPYQESTFTKHFVCLAVLYASSLGRPNLNQTSTIQTALFLSLPIRRYTPLYAAIRPGYTRPYTPNYIAKTQGFSMSFNSLLKNQQAHLGMLPWYHRVPYGTLWYYMGP